MHFNSLIKKYSPILEQAPEPQDAAEPSPTAEQPAPKPAEQAPSIIPPEGYVDMVRMLAKALVMNVPAGSVDTLFTTPVTKENAIAVREGLQNAIATSETVGDNESRIKDPDVQRFINSINENNFMAKYKQILAAMSKFSNAPGLR